MLISLRVGVLTWDLMACMRVVLSCATSSADWTQKDLRQNLSQTSPGNRPEQRPTFQC